MEVKKKIARKVVDDWRSDKVTLSWSRWVWNYLDSYGSSVWFRLRTGAAGLMEDRCDVR